MPRIFFLTESGEQIEAEAPVGFSLLQAAKANGVDLLGTCGGSMVCATCHVYIDETYAGLISAPSWDEELTLELAFAVCKDSRLGCQVKLSDQMDGMQVRVAPRMMGATAGR